MRRRPPLLQARLALSAVFFANGAVFASWATRVPEVQRRLSLGDGQLGLALFGVAAGCLLAMPAVGALVARRGSGPVTWIAGAAFCASLVLPALAGGLPTLALSLAVLGAANGGMDVAMNAHAAALERATGRPILASLHAVFSAGGLFGALAGAALAARGLSPLLHFAGAAALAGAVVVLSARRLLPATADAGGVRAPAFARPDRTLAALAVLAFCVLLSEGAIADWSAVYMEKATGAGPGRAAQAFAAFSLAMMLGRLLGDAATRALGAARVVRGGGLLAAAGLGLGLLTAHPLASLAGFACVGIGFACVFPAIVRAAAQGGGRGGGAAIAAVASAGYTGFLAGPPLIGLLAHQAGVRLALGLVVLTSLVVAALSPSVEPGRTAGAEAPSPGADAA